MKERGFRLLVVDDDPLVHQTIDLALPEQWTMTAVTSPTSLPHGVFDAAMIDMHLTDNLNRFEGIDVIKKLNQLDCHLDIIAMSGDLNRKAMEESLRAGASRFLAKPLTLDELLLTLSKIEAFKQLEQTRLNPSPKNLAWIGNSQASKDILQKIASVKGEKSPILIEGESGVGKEVIAQSIHRQEGPHRPLIAVNVAAITENLFESEFFGHSKGAFTGANQQKIGLIEAAHGGDLFLDEIEALAKIHQPKLLRFLESGEVRPVGANQSKFFQVRIIAATNRNLRKMCDDGDFREDLLWRLSGTPLMVPPLRERKEDIIDLARYFLKNQRSAGQKRFSEEALDALTSHHWPGNVRELKRVCEQIAISAPLPIIRKEDVFNCIGFRVSTPTPALTLDKGLAESVRKFESQLIEQVLKQHPEIDTAAKVLKVSKSNLYKKIKDFQIDL